VLINITGGINLGIHEVDQAASLVHDAADPDANIIFGAVIDESMEDEVKVTVIATGFDRADDAHPSRELREHDEFSLQRQRRSGLGRPAPEQTTAVLDAQRRAETIHLPARTAPRAEAARVEVPVPAPRSEMTATARSEMLPPVVGRSEMSPVRAEAPATGSYGWPEPPATLRSEAVPPAPVTAPSTVVRPARVSSSNPLAREEAALEDLYREVASGAIDEPAFIRLARDYSGRR
jgi:hypothetical protein